jgi:SAM domain (Sterile alpha motif)
MQVLPSLTHENLKELGVASFGHRVKLLDAIAALRNETSDKAPSVDAASTLSTPSAHPEDRLGYDSIVTHCCLVKLGGRGNAGGGLKPGGAPLSLLGYFLCP